MNVQRHFLCNTSKLETTHCPSTEECINRLINIYIVQYSSALTRNELLICTMWMNSDPKQDKLYDSIYIKFQKMQLILQLQNGIDQCLPKNRKDSGKYERARLQKDKRKLLGMMDMFIILIVVMVSQLYTYVKTSQIRHFKYVSQ